jgi:hypothetical protein
MKRTAVLAVLALFLGTATAFAADPCANCKGKDCGAQATVQHSPLSPLELKP